LALSISLLKSSGQVVGKMDGHPKTTLCTTLPFPHRFPPAAANAQCLTHVFRSQHSAASQSLHPLLATTGAVPRAQDPLLALPPPPATEKKSARQVLGTQHSVASHLSGQKAVAGFFREPAAQAPGMRPHRRTMHASADFPPATPARVVVCSGHGAHSVCLPMAALYLPFSHSTHPSAPPTGFVNCAMDGEYLYPASHSQAA
jgi:hypothetical protein